jgi:hypothetical protein
VSLTEDHIKSAERCPLKTETMTHMEGSQLIGRHDEATIFTYRQLADATKNFRQDCRLGRGGFGCVYKATLSNGQVCDRCSCFSMFNYAASLQQLATKITLIMMLI